ncbi:MAG: hypothetical protein Q4Q17_05080 [Tissierellia bacterium]|nr:hypothetical protein [Tissierellia bacterium]
MKKIGILLIIGMLCFMNIPIQGATDEESSNFDSMDMDQILRLFKPNPWIFQPEGEIHKSYFPLRYGDQEGEADILVLPDGQTDHSIWYVSIQDVLRFLRGTDIESVLHVEAWQLFIRKGAYEEMTLEKKKTLCSGFVGEDPIFGTAILWEDGDIYVPLESLLEQGEEYMKVLAYRSPFYIDYTDGEESFIIQRTKEGPEEVDVKEEKPSEPVEKREVEGEVSFQQLYLNGEKTHMESYLIEERNYYRLRDLAKLLRSTKAAFQVGYDEMMKRVYMIKGLRYEPLEEDGKPLPKGPVKGVQYRQTMALDRGFVEITSVLIAENNYVMLRDMAEHLGFTVDYNLETKAIEIVTP